MPQKSADSLLEIPGRMHPVLALMAFLPLLIIVLTLGAIAVQKIPLPLTVLLALVIICCAQLSYAALKHMLGGRIEFHPGELRIIRLFGNESYPWTSLEAVKVTPATGTFGDNPFTDLTERVGLGLFLRASKRDRDHDLDADIIICAEDIAGVQKMMRLADKSKRAIKGGVQPATRRRAPTKPTSQPGQRAEFRQRRLPSTVPPAS